MLLERYVWASQRFEAQDAVITAGVATSYRALDAGSETLVAALLPLRRRSVVAFCTLSPEYFASLVACMKAGAVVTPIDPSSSDAEIRAQVKRIDPAAWVCSPALLDRAESLVQGTLPLIDARNGTLYRSKRDAASEPLAPQSDGPQSDALGPNDLLHRVFTSGSSGHQSVASLSRMAILHDSVHTADRYGFQPSSIVLNLGRYTSSMVINAFWRSCLTGSALILGDLKKERIEALWDILESAGANIVQGQTSTLTRFAERRPRPDHRASKVQHIIIGGEALRATQLRRILEPFPCAKRVTHNYSTTQTMLIAAFSGSPEQLLSLPKIPVGTTAQGKTVRVVDPEGRDLPQGEIGEIVVESPYVASAVETVLSRSGLEIDAQDPSVRRYTTGDLGRINEHGLLEHCGRMDRSIKINGVQIDPGIIEQVLEQYPGVHSAVVMDLEVAPDDRRLLAGVVVDSRVDLSALFRHVAASLPLSHVPQGLVRLDEVPLGATGKLSPTAVEQLIRSGVEARGVASDGPVTDDTRLLDAAASEAAVRLESLLRSEWSNVLGGRTIEPDPSVFSQGADSLAVFEITTKINELFRTDLSPSWVLEYPSVREQAGLLAQTDGPALAEANDGSALGAPTVAPDDHEIKRLLGMG
jgi:acyl-CoA synthetase (AMP-forming)/AMP-acid ligase II/acyl carrier protein